MKSSRLIYFVVALVVAAIVFLVVKKSGKDPGTVTAPPPSNHPETSTGAPAPAPMPTPAEPVTIASSDVHPMPGKELDMATVALEAKMITNAQDLLAQGKPREALKQIDDYEHVPDRAALVPQAKYVKIQALVKVGGRRTDALALAMSTRNDPDMAKYQPDIDALLSDAGLIGPTPSAAPMP